MKFRSHIGVLPEEKILGQNLEVDCEVLTNFDFSGKDDLIESLSYVDFYKICEKVCQESNADLIETLACQMITQIKMTNPEKIDKVKIAVRKLAVPIDGIFDHVEIEMEG